MAKTANHQRQLMHVSMCAPNIYATISFKMAKLTANIQACSSAV